MLTPAGMEGYFEELGALLEAGTADTPARQAVSEKYGVFYPQLPASDS